MIQKVKSKKRQLIRLMNKEMQTFISSPSKDEQKFRLGLLVTLGAELRILKDRTRCVESQAEKIS